jgi:hypothetical protein
MKVSPLQSPQRHDDASADTTVPPPEDRVEALFSQPVEDLVQSMFAGHGYTATNEPQAAARREAWTDRSSPTPPTHTSGMDDITHLAAEGRVSPSVPPPYTAEEVTPSAPPMPELVKWQPGRQWTEMLQDPALKTALLNTHEEQVFGFHHPDNPHEYFMVAHNPNNIPLALSVYKIRRLEPTETESTYTFEQIIPKTQHGDVAVEDLEGGTQQVPADPRRFSGTWTEVVNHLELKTQGIRLQPAATPENILTFYNVEVKEESVRSIADITSSKASLVDLVQYINKPVAVKTTDGLYLLKGSDVTPRSGERQVSIHLVSVPEEGYRGLDCRLTPSYTCRWVDNTEIPDGYTRVEHPADGAPAFRGTFPKILKAYLSG